VPFVRDCRASSFALVVALAVPLHVAAAPAESKPAAPADGSGDGTTRVLDASGTVVARIVVRPDVAMRLDLPQGTYRLVAPDGTSRTVEVPSTGVLVVGKPRVDATAKPVTPASPPPSRAAARRAARPPNHKWTHWGAPLLGALIPGLGHAVTHRPGAGFGIFAGAAGLLFGSIALGRAGDPREGAAYGDPGRSATKETLRQLGFVAATDTLALLWIGQAADAWVTATGKHVNGKTDHLVTIGFTRSTAIGVGPGEPAIARYEDWTLHLLGHVSPRVMVGLADMGLHLGPQSQVTVQASAKVAVRAFEIPRFWLVPAFAVIMQGTSARDIAPLGGGETPRESGRFAAIPYLELEGRIFVLDRLSLDVAPRFSVPLATRFYGRGAAIPRFTPTFELAAGTKVYF
jgi:hypothetical protein